MMDLQFTIYIANFPTHRTKLNVIIPASFRNNDISIKRCNEYQGM
jgi:hypothetical protein